jgi:hypothetical protein
MAASINSWRVFQSNTLRTASLMVSATIIPVFATGLLAALPWVIWPSAEPVASPVAHPWSQLTAPLSSLGNHDALPESVTDADVDTDPSHLQPHFEQAIKQLLNTLGNDGYEFIILETLRSPERQTALYQQGRHPGIPGPVVTNARAGESLHQKGLAIDLAPLVRGQPSTNIHDPLTRKAYEALGRRALASGLQWGGNWRLADWGHVQWPVFPPTNAKPQP